MKKFTSTVTVLGAGAGAADVFMLYSGKTRAMAQAEANNSSRVVTRTTNSSLRPGKWDWWRGAERRKERKGGKTDGREERKEGRRERKGGKEK